MKGAAAKQEITKKIIDMFPGAFAYDKEIRIPWNEDGSEIQIKCALTCAKTNVSNGSDEAIPGAATANSEVPFTEVTPENFGMNQPTDEEKANVESLLEKLGLT